MCCINVTVHLDFIMPLLIQFSKTNGVFTAQQTSHPLSSLVFIMGVIKETINNGTRNKRFATVLRPDACFYFVLFLLSKLLDYEFFTIATNFSLLFLPLPIIGLPECLFHISKCQKLK